MSSFFERTFGALAHQPETISAILGTSSPIMNCSAVPVTLSSDKTYDLLCPEEQPETEQKLLQLFSTFSDTMQFTEKLRIQNNHDKDFVKGILKNLVMKRYFSRTIRLLQLPDADALIDACSSHSTSKFSFKACCCCFQRSSPTATPKIFSNLRSLSIEESYGHMRNALQNKQLRTICSLCPFLQDLNIPGQSFTDEGLELISSLKHLQVLELSQCYEITDNGLQHLTKLSCLQTLDLGCCPQLTDNGVQHLAKLSSLEFLNLRSCHEITNTGLKHLGNLLSLQSLNLHYCDKITDDGIQHLAKLHSLRSLNLDSCKLITDTGLQHLAQLTSLRSLVFFYCKLITDSGLEHLAKLSSLQSLNLGYCELITDSGLQHLASLSSLQELSVQSCDKITDEGCRVFSASTKVIR